MKKFKKNDIVRVLNNFDGGLEAGEVGFVRIDRSQGSIGVVGRHNHLTWYHDSLNLVKIGRVKKFKK